MIDPYADSKEVQSEYGFSLRESPNGKYNAVIVAVNHKEYVDMNEKDFSEILNDGGLIVDVKGIYRNEFSKFNYWSL